jgi:hypothetical protein
MRTIPSALSRLILEILRAGSTVLRAFMNIFNFQFPGILEGKGGGFESVLALAETLDFDCGRRPERQTTLQVGLLGLVLHLTHHYEVLADVEIVLPVADLGNAGGDTDQL